MSHHKPIIVKAICIIKNTDDELLLSSDLDKVKKDYYYRPLGGQVEFNERAIDTVKREFKEEINADLINIKPVTILENLFVCDGVQGHEIMFVFKGELNDKNMYKKNNLSFMNESNGQAVKLHLIKTDDCLNGKYRFVPNGLKQFIKDI